MDFGLVTLEALAGPEGGGGGGFSKATDPEMKVKGLGSELVEQEDSGASEEDWKSTKMAKVDSLSSHKPMPCHHGSPLVRSNAFSTGYGRKEEHTLSFSSVKSEVPFLRKDGEIVDKSIHNSFFPYYQLPPSAYPRNAGCDTGSLNASMHGIFAGVRGPFTPSQWIELEDQALIYKYITSNVPVPSNLLSPIKRSLYRYGLSGSTSGSLPQNSCKLVISFKPARRTGNFKSPVGHT